MLLLFADKTSAFNFRAIAPPVFGRIYSWSLTQIKDVDSNTHALGFPFNQYFAFIMISIAALANLIFVTQFPKSLDKQKTTDMTVKIPIRE